MLLQFPLSRSDVQYLSRPMPFPHNGVLVGFALTSTRVHAGDEIGVVLYGERLVSPRVLTTASATAPQLEPPPSLARLRLNVSDLERQRHRVRVPPAATPGAYSLRIPGMAVSFGHFEVIK